MNEVLTRQFWRDVKKTFYTALEGPPAEEKASETAGDTSPRDLPKPETPPPPPASSQET